MNKFLFSDKKNGVKEVQSLNELDALIKSSEQPDKISIWLFNSAEWISYQTFLKQFPENIRIDTPTLPNNQFPKAGLPPAISDKKGMKRMLYFIGAAICIFLVFNFTKIDWEKAEAVTMNASRPANILLMDMDSLIKEIEYKRGQQIDKNSKANLRLRNTWPDRIMLQVKADREKSNEESRFYNFVVSIDNTTGYIIENAIVKLLVWKNKKISHSDTLRFENIMYNKLSKRNHDVRYKGDSIAVSFESINSKTFNFCYSASARNISGNENDRWFCRNY
jgi:hypothetical protein